MKEKMLKKIKSVKFWLSLSGAVVIVLQLFGLKISAPYVNEVVSAICSVFVILGIMVPDNQPGEGENPENEDSDKKSDDEEKSGDAKDEVDQEVDQKENVPEEEINGSDAEEKK